MGPQNRLFQVGGLAAGALVAGGLAPRADAAPVTITNPGFGVVTDAAGAPVNFVPGDYTSGMGATVLNQYRQNMPVTVAGWVGDHQDFAEGVEEAGDPLPGGTHAYLNPGGVFRQVLASTVGAGTYVLMVNVGDRNDRDFAAPTVELYDAATGTAFTPAASSNPTPANGAYVPWSQTYVIPNASPNNLGIRFISGGDESHLDNVALDFTPIPEPASAAVLGVGAFALLGRRRRR